MPWRAPLSMSPVSVSARTRADRRDDSRDAIAYGCVPTQRLTTFGRQRQRPGARSSGTGRAGSFTRQAPAQGTGALDVLPSPPQRLPHPAVAVDVVVGRVRLTGSD